MSSSIVVHAREILVHPKEEWRVIDGEQASIPELLRTYIAPLAAIGPIAATIGFSLFGIALPFVGRYRMPFGTALAQGVVRYALAIGSVFVLALVIDALAPTFGGEKNRLQALKVAAYASTAAWLAGIFTLVPPLAILGVLGLYSLYLLYLGLPVLMKAPEEKALAYTAVVVICALVLFTAVGWIAGMFVTVPGPAFPGA
jgi:Yip1-like protein